MKLLWTFESIKSSSRHCVSNMKLWDFFEWPKTEISIPNKANRYIIVYQMKEQIDEHLCKNIILFFTHDS